MTTHNLTKQLDNLYKNTIESRYSEAVDHINNPSPPVTPAYLHAHNNILSLFCEKAHKAGASCHHASSLLSIPKIIEHIIQPQEHMTLHAPSSSWLKELSFHKLINLSHEIPHINTTWALSIASSAAAETGSLCVASSQENPMTLNFVPEKSITLLQNSTLFPSLEEALSLANSTHPRSLSFVTGPSRTADIAQQLVMGAHGPKSLDIILFSNL